MLMRILLALAIALLALAGAGTTMTLAYSAQADSPRPIISFGAAEPSGSAACYEYNVAWSSPPLGASGETLLSVTDSEGNEVVRHSEVFAFNTPLSPQWCGDLLQDGSLALGYSYYTGGASGCCSIMYVVHLPDGERLLDAHSGYTEPIESDAAGPLALKSTVIVWPDTISHAYAQYIPTFLIFEGTQYVEATRQFAGALRAALVDSDLALQNLLRASSDQEARREGAVVSYALATLLGQGDDWLSAWASRLSASDRAWLASQRGWLMSFLAEAVH